MRRFLAAAALALFGGGQAIGQEFVLVAEATLVAAAIDGESALATAGDGLLADIGLVAERSDVFENGLTLAWRGEVRVQRDARSRPSFAGVVGNCNPSAPGCPFVRDGGVRLTPISPATGLAASGRLDDEDVFAVIEGASVSLAGAWGEGVAGLDAGAAARLDARAPTVMKRVSAFSPGLDPTGLVVARARNDVAGPSFKATYMTPRLLGVRLGASFTPEANRRSADFDPRYSGAGLANAELVNVWEGAASFSRRFPQGDIRVRAAVTTIVASGGSRFAEFGDYQSWGAGFEAERGGWTGGVRWLRSDNAWRAGEGDYEAVEVGLVRQGDTWRIGGEASWASDSLGQLEGESWILGGSRKINDNLDIGVAYTNAGAGLPVDFLGGVARQNVHNEGLIIELSVRN
ncbi:MAG: hypothetical protein SGJ21_16410 [Alphaproteobacteria bacterium]|nr:hypothetical protein [Alphaproteobacteria bacterium]